MGNIELSTVNAGSPNRTEQAAEGKTTVRQLPSLRLPFSLKSHTIDSQTARAIFTSLELPLRNFKVSHKIESRGAVRPGSFPIFKVASILPV